MNSMPFLGRMFSGPMRITLLGLLYVLFNLQKIYLRIAERFFPANELSVIRRRRANQGKMHKDAALQVALEVRDLADLAGTQLFPCSGTLLGLQRHGRILEHDVDIDYGMFWDDPKAADLLARLAASENCVGYRTVKLGYWTRCLNPWIPALPNNVIVHKFDMISSDWGNQQVVPVDVFVHFEALGFVAHGIWNRLWINTDLNLKRKSFGGSEFVAPHDVKKYLTENYGDYEIERKDFEITVDCPNCVTLYAPSSIVNFLRLQYVYRRAGWQERTALLEERYQDMLRQLWLGPTKPPLWKIGNR